MATISQGLTVPAALANGQIADASQIIPLYTAMNAFVIPATIGIFQTAFADNVLYTVATGATKDWPLSVSNSNSIFFWIPFSWSGAGAAPTFQFRLNAAAITTAADVTMTNAATGSGIIIGFLGFSSVSVPQPFMALTIESNARSTLRAVTANAATPVVQITSVGIAPVSAGATFLFQGVRMYSGS